MGENQHLRLQSEFMLGQITLDLRWWALTANLGAHQGGGIYVELDFSEHTKTVLHTVLHNAKGDCSFIFWA